MATDCGDGDYLGAYRRFFEDFVAQVDPDDQLPVKVSSYDLTEAEIGGEIIDWTLQYLNQKYCPPSLQSYLVHLVMEEVKVLCSKYPETCGWRIQEKTFAPLRLMHTVINKVNEICSRYLDNSRLALLPPPPSTPIPFVSRYAIKNTRRKMEDRHVVIHDLHTIFSIQDDSAGNYYAVFDGHAGQDAAVYCAAHLHQYLVESIHYPTDPERALRDAFLTTDAHFIEKSNKQNLNSGTTAVCTLLLNRKLYVAWVGDSQAVLAKRGQITQLVNPHKPDRDDERERVNDMGGAVMHWGIWRVNGQLAVSRAIGDVQYKPYVTGDPDIRCIPLDGTEDFLIVACDGLWDFVSEAMATTLVYQQLREDPRDLEAVSQRLVFFARSQGSTDNISTIVVFLTNPHQIAARNPSSHPLLADVQLNNMESTNPFLSNANGLQFEANSFGKQQQATNGTCAPDNEENLHYRDNFEIPSNGKHANGAGFDNNTNNHDNNDEDDDDDDDDLGPETDVDAVDEGLESVDQPIENLSRELFPEKHDDRENLECGGKDLASEDLLSASPCPAEPDQHALIPESDNVADSEDSEDEWNYYPNKEKERNLLQSGETGERKDDKVTTSPKSTNEQINDLTGNQELSEVGLGEGDCLNEENIEKPELIDSDICANSKLPGELSAAEQDDMDFQLNPNAAEFVPISPPKLLSTRANLNDDFLLSGSPQKQTPEMDDITVPSHGEFQVEVSLRPHETEQSNGEAIKELPSTDFTDYLMERQKSGNGIAPGLDESEISSTKAEFGDESTTSFMTATDFQRTGISIADDSFVGSDREDYDIAKDPMAMSFTPGDFQAAFEKEGDDLNAIHQLNDSDLIGDEDTPEINDEPFTAQSPELHPELTTLVTPDTDHPPPTTAFPDSRDDNIVSINENQSNAFSPEPSVENETNLMSDLVELIPSSCPPGSHSAETDLKTFDPESGETGYQALNTSSPLAGGATPEKTFALSPEPEVPAFCSVSDNAESLITHLDIENNISPIHSAPLDIEASSLPVASAESIGLDVASSLTEELTSSLQAVSPVPNARPLESEKISTVPDLVSFGNSETQDSPLSPQPTSNTNFEVEDAFESHHEVYSPILDAELNVSKAIIDHVLDTPPVSQNESLLNEELNTSPDEELKLVLDQTELPESPAEKEKQELFEESKFERVDVELALESPNLYKPFEESSAKEILFDLAHPPCSTEAEENFSQDLIAEDIAEKQMLSESSSELVKEEHKDLEPKESLTETEVDSESQKKIYLPEDAEIDTESNILEGESKTLETPVNEGSAINTPVMNLSESMQEFTGLEEQLKPKAQAPLSNGVVSDIDTKPESQIPTVETEETSVVREVALNDTDLKTDVTRKTEDKTETEPTTEESPVSVPVAAAAAVAVAAGAVAAVAATGVTKMTKAKAAVKASPKTSTLTKTTSNKSTPTSPTKATTVSQRITGTTTTKKPSMGTASRPKQLETTKTSVTSTTSKSPAPKSVIAPKTNTLTKTTVSRTGALAASKPKPTSTTSKPASASLADKKPTTNGDVKPASKPAAPKPTSRSLIGSSSTTTKPLTKTTATARSTTTTTPAPPRSRPATSATAAAKSKLTATGTTSAAAPTRPKSSPAPGLSVAATSKLKSTPTKSPVTDKQAKETTNKQLSSARTSTSTLTKTSGRPSSTGTTSLAKRSLASKNPPPAAAQPQKKPAPITRPGGKLSTVKNATKTTISSTTKTEVEVEVVQNGVSEIHEKKTIISNNTLEEDVPQKDVSPVTSSTDNQLIMTAD